MVVTVFGDSIAYGKNDSHGGWVERWRTHLRRPHSIDESSYPQLVNLYNLSIPGNTTDDVLYRFEAELHPRIRPNEETVCLFAIGTNDAAIDLPSEKHRVEPTNVQVNTRKLIENARAYTSHVLFVGPLSVDDQKTNPSLWNPLRAHRSVDIQLYNGLIREAVEREEAVYIDLHDLWINEMGKRGLSEDGLHPNEIGHEWIAKQVSQRLSHLVPITSASS